MDNFPWTMGVVRGGSSAESASGDATQFNHKCDEEQGNG